MTGTTSAFAREDTLFGVCFALGEDFGFDPLYLRLLFGSMLLAVPVEAFAAYALCGLLVGLSRWLVPEPRAEEPEAERASDLANEPQAQLPLAA
jgi:phage shock protein PspC (stress-responsive transcriptional regulator)